MNTVLQRLISLIFAVLLISGCSDSGIQSNTLVGYVNPGDPELGTPDGYAGSQACKVCHLTKYESWRGTSHNLSLRDPDQRGLDGKGIVADYNENGIVDFKEDLDLGVLEMAAEFHKYGANAPVLGYKSSTSKYTIRIGEVTYNVDRVYGGNGLFSQIYLTKIDRSYYILPVQYDEILKTYSAFKLRNWYDSDNQPIYYNTKTPTSLGRGYDSFERMCSGCHNTGIFMQYDSNTKEYLTGYMELNIGCEECHKGGENHKKQGGGKGADSGGVFNPNVLMDGTMDGLKRANELCGKCHIRGKSVAEVGTNSSRNRFEFPAKKDELGNILFYLMGDVLSSYINSSTDTNDYWGYNTEDGTFIASRSSRQHLLDMNIGAHSPDSNADPFLLPSCFTCHDPHGTENGADIVTSITIDNLTINVSVEDNTLCLACHAERSPFANISKTDVASIAIREASYDIVKREVSRHTKHTYLPEEYKVGRCTQCHTVKTAKSAMEYDITSHTFNVIPPTLSMEMDINGEEPIPNSCEGCHSDTNDFGVEKYEILTNYTDESAVIPDSHEQNASWNETYHKLYTSLKGDAECQSCHLRNNESILSQANPGCTTYCHGI